MGVWYGWYWAYGFTLFLVYAAQHTTALNLGIIQGVIPAFVMFLGWLIYRTSIGWFQFLGFVHHFWGFSARQWGSYASIIALEFNSGDLLMIAALPRMQVTLLRLRVVKYRPPYCCVFLHSAFVSCSFFTVIEYANGDLILPLKGFLLIIYCAVCPSILSQTCFIRGVELTGANRAGLCQSSASVCRIYGNSYFVRSHAYLSSDCFDNGFRRFFWQIEVKYSRAQIALSLKKVMPRRSRAILMT